MKRIAFTMQLYKGCETEYISRHDKIWPQLQALLKQAGIHNYSIFLQESTGVLFAVLTTENPEATDALGQEPIMRQWWDYMKDLMETNPDDSPVINSLQEVFYLP